MLEKNCGAPYLNVWNYVTVSLRMLLLVCLGLRALSGIAFAQATTNGLGIPVPAQRSAGAAMPPSPDTVSPQTHPAPTPTPSAAHLSISGKVRGYDFQRFNRVQNLANPDRHALEFGAVPHLDYRIGDTPLNIGYTYGGATSFGFNGPKPIENARIDNTLPGFPVNQPAHELYLQYKDAGNAFTVGAQELNHPWTPSSDSRILPVSYEGIDATVKLLDTLTFSATRILRFEHWNSSKFEPNTLLTATYPGTIPVRAPAFTPGTLRVALNFHPSDRIVVSAENNGFYDIANLAYAEVKYDLAPSSKANPYAAVQYVAENSLGSNEVGVVRNHTIGGQLGANVVKGLLLAVSGDFSPPQYANVNATSAANAAAGFFVGGGGTGDVVRIGPGRYKVAYGGLASPYTDTTAGDPLYTTQITQGLVDRRSAGNSYKAALVYTSPTKQLKLVAAQAWYQYSNDISRNLNAEFDADGTYYFNAVRAGAYKGFFMRVRIAPNHQPAIPFRFEYQRFQTEYDF